MSESLELADDTPVPYDDAEATEYTPGYHARNYLSGLRTAFADDTRPEIDPDRIGAADHPAEFATLRDSWHRILDAAETVNERYYSDWDIAGGPLTVIAPAVRRTALQELGSVWDAVCEKYISETLEIDRDPWDCPFCGEHVGADDVVDHDRCPNCLCVLWTRDSGRGWQ